MTDCCVVTHDQCVALGESHQFIVTFQDSTGQPKDVTGYSVVITIAEQMGSPTSLFREELPVTGDSITITLTDDNIDQIGAGQRHYDIWLTNNTTYNKPVVAGLFEVKRLPGSA